MSYDTSSKIAKYRIVKMIVKKPMAVHLIEIFFQNSTNLPQYHQSFPLNSVKQEKLFNLN